MNPELVLVVGDMFVPQRSMVIKFCHGGTKRPYQMFKEN